MNEIKKYEMEVQGKYTYPLEDIIEAGCNYLDIKRDEINL